MSKAIYLLSPTPKEGTIALPMIDFTVTAKSIDFSHSDTLIFTSKQAVITAEMIDVSWKNYPSIAIGAATKKQIEDLGGKVIYHPKSFYGETLSQDIAQFFRDKKLLYLRPKEISFDSKGFLEKEGIELQEQIIYKTSCIQYSAEEKPSKSAIIIFTSPSTIHCFLKNFEWDESYTAVVIGKATKVHLPANAEYVVADTPLISSCIEKANEIVNSSF
ncbi:MAG: uroporphyrinogen-III synthase [Campylobacterota bacterium]|nr:uroporphyrinogen-III synthase [Campylobacterota bacterium]